MEILIDGYSELVKSKRIGHGTSGTHIQWNYKFNTYTYWFNDADLLHVHTKEKFWVYWAKKEALGKALYDLENRPQDNEIDF